MACHPKPISCETGESPYWRAFWLASAGPGYNQKEHLQRWSKGVGVLMWRLALVGAWVLLSGCTSPPQAREVPPSPLVPMANLDWSVQTGQRLMQARARRLMVPADPLTVTLYHLNFQYGSEEQPILKVPQPLIREAGARVMSLTDGSKKMSKSDPSDQSRIDLTDAPEMIVKKIKRAKTDPERGLWFDDPARPECHNLLNLYMLLSGQSKAAVAAECATMGWGQFKPLLAETAVTALAPIQETFHALMADRPYLDSLLKQGREKAAAVANLTLTRVKDALGYSRPL